MAVLFCVIEYVIVDLFCGLIKLIKIGGGIGIPPYY